MEMCDWEQLRRRENKMAANEITRQIRKVEADYVAGTEGKFCANQVISGCQQLPQASSTTRLLLLDYRMKEIVTHGYLIFSNFDVLHSGFLCTKKKYRPY